MSKKWENFLMVAGLFFFLLPLSEIFSIWIIESRIFFSEELYGDALVAVFGLVLILISFFYVKMENRKIYTVLFLSLLPGCISMRIILEMIFDNVDVSTQMVAISIVLISLTILFLVILHKLGFISKDATDESIFGH